MRITSDGNVGIGTSTPNSLLTISGTGAFQQLPRTTDPGCTTTADIGKFWFDNTTTTTAMKVCVNIAGTLTWKTATLAP